MTYKPSLWKLNDLLESTDAAVVDAAISELETAIQAVEAERNALQAEMSRDAFNAFLQKYETLTRAGYRLGAYAALWFSSDTQSPEALSFKGKVDQLMLEAQNRTLFFSLWWKSLDDKAAERLMSAAGDLVYFLQQIRNFKPYTLSEAEEKLINLKDMSGIDAVVTLYDMITNKFAFTLTIDGAEKTLTREELMTYVRSPNPDLRQAAYEELYRVYSDEGTLLAQIYNYRVRDWANEQVNLRRFKSPLAARNLANDIPDNVVDTLLDVVEEQAGIFHRYFALKAKWLNLPKLRRYDLYAPLSSSEKKIDYAAAAQMALETFDQFSPQTGALARRVFEEGHIDSEVRAGKRGGAFCMSTMPDITPFVLLNYTGEVRDVATLAHELGHAIHAMLAEDHSILTFHSALPLAETASTFSEMLLTERLLAEEKDPAVRRDILAAALDDAYATILRQAYFVLFEREAHALILEGKTAEEMNQAYLANLHRQFGDVLDISDPFKWEWISIPHIFHVPFYCYAYSFGQLLVLSLYQRYKEEGAAFIPQYLKILSYGGSASPQHILSEAGVDMTSPDFWRGGFKVLEGMIDELEAIS
ncbi:MAG TPA: M3 family oligoendopeptidase [Chloroflexi bacterium]|nr:M3 family oligoendopeptidase [Chloroflexota bacterium]